METYTQKQKADMYASVAEKLTDVVGELQAFVDAEPKPKGNEEPSEEVGFAQSNANQLTNLVGNFAVKAKAASKVAD